MLASYLGRSSYASVELGTFPPQTPTVNEGTRLRTVEQGNHSSSLGLSGSHLVSISFASQSCMRHTSRSAFVTTGVIGHLGKRDAEVNGCSGEPGLLSLLVDGLDPQLHG